MWTKIKRKVSQNKVYQHFIQFTQSVFLDRGKLVTLYLFWIIFIKKIKKNHTNFRAGSVAFSLSLSIFPFILFLLSLLPYVPINHEQVELFMKETLPKDIFGFVEHTMNDIMQNKRSGLLSFSFIFAVITATDGSMSLINSFNSTYRFAKRRSFFKKRLVALFLTFLMVVVFLIACLILLFGEVVLTFLKEEGLLNKSFFAFSVVFLKYMVVFLIFFTVISLIYFIAPANTKRWHFVSYGSIFASIATILITNIFSYYLENFATYNKVYGSIGALIALMLWIYFIAFVLLLGFEMNASLIEGKHIRLNNKKMFR